MLRAVLFDWGDTLMQWKWDEEFVEKGHRAGLTAIGRADLAEEGEVTARFREAYLPTFWQPGAVEEPWWRTFMLGALPSTVVVSILAAVALAFDARLSALAGGVLIGMGLLTA